MEIIVEGAELAQPEIDLYVQHVERNNPRRVLDKLFIRVDGEYVDLDARFEPVPFDRIRRITGYLVGTTQRFNDAKRAEERDRVKHSVANLA